MVRAGSSYGQGRGFDSLLWYYAGLAQLGEHLPYKQGVTGSNPVPRTIRRYELRSSGGDIGSDSLGSCSQVHISGVIARGHGSRNVS